MADYTKRFSSITTGYPNIHIKNLGPIVDVIYEMKEFSVIIGEQASGKSTLCKCIYLAYMFPFSITSYFYKRGIGKIVIGQDIRNDLLIVFTDYFNKLFLMPPQACMDLTFNYTEKVSIYVNTDEFGVIKIAYSEDFETFLNDLAEVSLKQYRITQPTMQTPLTFAKANQAGDMYSQLLSDAMSRFINMDYVAYYLPANRSMLTNHSDLIDINGFDAVSSEFVSLINRAKKLYVNGPSDILQKYASAKHYNLKIQEVQQCISEITTILKGQYFSKDSGEYLVVSNGAFIPLQAISSGQQSLLWLLYYLLSLMITGEKALLLIEEPEENVHPLAQKQVIDFLIKFCNFTGSKLIMTTHSPYVLTALNPYLLEAFEKREVFDRHLRPETFSAHQISSDGLISIVDKSLGLIDLDLLEGVVSKISEEMEKVYGEQK